MNCGAALARLMGVNIMNFAGIIQVKSLSETAWASVTFAGARHRLLVSLDGSGATEAAADFLSDLPDLEWPLAGQIVADVAVIAEQRHHCGRHAELELEVLTIEDH